MICFTQTNESNNPYYAADCDDKIENIEQYANELRKQHAQLLKLAKKADDYIGLSKVEMTDLFSFADVCFSDFFTTINNAYYDRLEDSENYDAANAVDDMALGI